MNDNRNVFDKSGEIDLVDFSSNREMEAIREQERIEREKRMKRAAQIRRAEMLKRRRNEQIKQTVMAWGMLLLALIVVVALIVGVVSMFKGGDEKNDEPVVGEVVSESETQLMKAFLGADTAVYETGNHDGAAMTSAVNMTNDIIGAAFDEQNLITHGSELSLLTEAYLWNGSFGDNEKIKNLVRDFPIYSNGYVWSSEKSMRSPVTKSYLYDTNAAYISAVCEICLWEGDGSFLSEVDTTGEANGDKSAGMTVGEKLDAVVAHLFDSDDYLNGGGVRYNETDGLVYVLTSGNNGKESGEPSNIFYNYRFGYLDTYNNLAFNAAMQDLSALYTLLSDKEKAEHYKKIAKTNKDAINKKLYDKSKGRYVGYIDSDSSIHDYGFTAINLLAVTTGVADKEQTESIKDWISGTRKIGTDSISEMNVMKSSVMPVFNTIKANDVCWESVSDTFSLSDAAAFENYWLNGGASALAGNYYMLCDKKDAANKASKLVSAFENGKFVLPSNENSEPKLYYALYASNAVRELFGISTDGKNLSVTPSLGGENAGIHDIAFSENSYDILFHDGSVYVFSDYEEAVRLKIGSFDAEKDVVITTVEDGKIVTSENVKADESGVVSVSKKIGGNTYIKLEAVKEQEK